MKPFASQREVEASLIAADGGRGYFLARRRVDGEMILRHRAENEDGITPFGTGLLEF